MTTQKGLDGSSRISFTPWQLFWFCSIVLAAGMWCWKIDHRTEEHDTNMKLLGEKVAKEFAEVKTEISELKMVCGARTKLATTK